MSESLSEWDETFDEVVHSHQSKLKAGKLELTKFKTKEELFQYLDKQ